MALGWVVCQTLCLRRFFEKEKTSLKNKLLQVPHTSYLIDQVRNLRPKHILPIINCIGNNKIYAQENDEAEWKSEKPFGPITIEEVTMLFCRHYNL